MTSRISSRSPKARLLPLAAASLLLGLAACGGATQFQSAQAVAINGTPPPPPPPPPPEAPKPPPRVELRDNKINFAEKIQFQVNKAVIKPESFSLLHDIAEVIKQNPQVKKISIEGHASAEGKPAANKKLSDERAKAVADYLVKKEGINASELTAKGWGSEKPIASNDTEEGREKNRRVDFLVVDQDVTTKKVEIDPTTGKERVVSEKKSELTDSSAAASPTPDATPKSGDAKKKPGHKGADAKKSEGNKQ